MYQYHSAPCGISSWSVADGECTPSSSTRVPVQFLHLATQVCSPHLLINKGNKIIKQVSDWRGKVVSGQSAEALVNVGGRI